MLHRVQKLLNKLLKSDINRRLCKSNSKPNLTNCCKYQLIIH